MEDVIEILTSCVVLNGENASQLIHANILPMVVVVDSAKCSKEKLDFLTQFCDEYIKDRVSRLVSVRERANSVVGNVLRKWLIKKHFGVNFCDQRVAFEKDGKPYLENHDGIHFNISHSGTMVVCVVHDRPIGVDVQKIVEYKPKVADYIFDENEKQAIATSKDKDWEFSRLWAEKESKIKLLGCGVAKHKGKKMSGIRTKSTEINGYCLSYSVFEN